MPSKILVIPDTQVKAGTDRVHIKQCGQWIVDKRPDVIVCLGDWWDFPSLSSYDKGKRCFEGRRLLQDIEEGKAAMELLLAPLKRLQAHQRACKKRVYHPRMVFCLGNHEDRLSRVSSNAPEFDGVIGLHMLGLEEMGWEVYDFLFPVDIEGIFFVHYMANPFNGKPYSGTALSILKNVGKSFVAGHKQVLDVAIRPTVDGKMQLGVIAGAFYSHLEEYKGHTGNNHWRGMVMLYDAHDGYANPSFIDLDYLNKRYKGMA